MEPEAAAADAPSMFAGSSAVTLCAHCQRNQELLLRKLASFDSSSLISDDDPERDESFQRFKAAAESNARLCHDCQQRLQRLLSAQDEAIRRERIQERQRAAASKVSSWRKIHVAGAASSNAAVAAAAATSSASATPPRSASWIVLHLLSLFISTLLILSHIVPTLRGIASQAPHLEGRVAYTLGEWLHASLSHSLLLLAHWALHEQEFVLTMLTFLEVVSTARRSGSSGDRAVGDGSVRTQRWTGSLWGLAQLSGLAAAAVMFVARTEWVRVSPRIVWMLAVANLLACSVRTIVLLKRGVRQEGNTVNSEAKSMSRSQARGRLTPTSAAFDFGASSSPPGTPLRTAAAAPRSARSGSHSRSSRSMSRAYAADAVAADKSSAATNADSTAMHDQDAPTSATAAASAPSQPKDAVSPAPMNDTEEYKHAPAPAPLPVPTQSLRSLMTQQAQAAAAEHKRRLSPIAALLADEDGLAQQDEDEIDREALMHDQPEGDGLAAATALDASNHDNDSVGDEIEFEPSLVSLDGPAANRARFSQAQTQALAALVWPMHQRMQAPAASNRSGRKNDSSSSRRRGRSNLRATADEEDESALPAGLEEESDDAHYLDYAFAHNQAQRGGGGVRAAQSRSTPHAREGSVELMPGSLFSAPPDQRLWEQRAAQPHEAFGGDATAADAAALMTDSPGFGANAASSLISSIDLATGDGASSSNPIARASQWLFTEVVKRTPLFGSTPKLPQHALAVPVQQLPPPFAADHQPVFGHAAAASSSLSSSSVFHSPLSSPLGRFSTSPSQTLFPSSRGSGNGTVSATQLSPPSFVASEEQIRRAVISSSSLNHARDDAVSSSHNGVAASPPRRPRRRSLEAELKQSDASLPVPVLLKRREAIVASVVGLACYVAKESSSSLVAVRASALLLYGLLLGSVAALLLWRSSCSRSRHRHRSGSISCRSRLMVVAASVMLLVLAARALSQATGLIDSLALPAGSTAAASAASSSSPNSAALSDPMLSRLAAALTAVQRLQSLLKELIRALVRWVSRHAEILLMIAAVAGIAFTQRARV